MKNILIKSLVVLFAVILVAGCGSAPVKKTTTTTTVTVTEEPGKPTTAASLEEEVLLETIGKCDFIGNPPPSSNLNTYFEGVSPFYSSDDDARAFARRDGIKQVLEERETIAKNKIEQKMLNVGLKSSTIDPTMLGKEYAKFLTVGKISGVHTEKTCVRKYRRKDGNGYKAYVLISVPTDQLRAANKDFVKSLEKMEKDLANKEAADQVERFKKLEEQIKDDPFFKD